MAFIYMDESGDLGFDFNKPKTSKYFMITFLITENQRPVEKLVRKVFAGFTKTQIKAHDGMLHAYKETPRTRQRLLNGLAQKEVIILTIYLNKQKVYTKLQDEKQVLYNLVTNILLDRLMTLKLVPLDQEINLIASRYETNKLLNENFKDYLSNEIRQKHKVKIHIEIKTPQQDKCLQVVDMACWAIYRKWEHQDETYYNLIKDVIVEEKSLFS